MDGDAAGAFPLPPCRLCMSDGERTAPERLFTYDFTVLTLVATFGFSNIAVFYGFNTYLERLGVDPTWRGLLLGAEPLAAFCLRPFLSVLVTPRNALALVRASLVGMETRPTPRRTNGGAARFQASRPVQNGWSLAASRQAAISVPGSTGTPTAFPSPGRNAFWSRRPTGSRESRAASKSMSGLPVKDGPRRVCVRVVDVFGFEAEAVVEVA